MNEIICTSCGASMPTGTKFCVECGAKILEAPEPALVGAASSAASAQPHPQSQYQPPPLPAQTQPQPYQPVQAVPTAAPYAAPSRQGKPMGVVAFVLTMLLFMLPVVGIVLAFVWALGKNTGQNRKSFATAQLIVWGMFFAGVLAWYIVNFSAVNELVKVILA